MFQAHRVLYHSSLGLQVIKKKQKGSDLKVQGGGHKPSRKETTLIGLMTFALKMAQAKAAIWP